MVIEKSSLAAKQFVQNVNFRNVLIIEAAKIEFQVDDQLQNVDSG